MGQQTSTTAWAKVGRNVTSALDNQTIIDGSLAKRMELLATNAKLRDRMVIVTSVIEAVKRMLDSLDSNE